MQNRNRFVFSQLENGVLFKYNGRVYMKLCDEKNSWSGKYNSVRLQDPILQKIPDNTNVLPLKGELVFREITTFNHQSRNEDEEDESEGDFLEEIDQILNAKYAIHR